MYKSPLLVCLAAAFSLPASAATIIYQDDFSGSAGTNLSGQITDIGGGTWTSHVNESIRANGQLVMQGNETAYLPFTPQSGFIYTATIGIQFANTVGNTGGGSLQLGFMGTGFTTQPISGNSTTIGHVFVRQNGSAGSRYVAGNTSGAEAANGTYNDGTPVIDIITLTLDTTGTAWTYKAAINGNPLGNTYTYMTNPTIGAIGFGGNDVAGALGTFSTFSLTSVPEPSALLLCLSGGLMIMRRRRH